VSQNRFELILKFLHFVDSSTIYTNSIAFPPPPQIFRVQPIQEIMNQNFHSAYLPSENISVDESLTLWWGNLGIRQDMMKMMMMIGGGGGDDDDEWHYSPDGRKLPLIRFHSLS
jgi:hypothetical protein